MPENESLHANSIQILRNIQAFRERLKKGRDRFKFVSNNQEIEQNPPIKEPQIEQIPENPKRKLNSFINNRGRGYAPHFTWGITGPSAFDNGGNI